MKKLNFVKYYQKQKWEGQMKLKNEFGVLCASIEVDYFVPGIEPNRKAGVGISIDNVELEIYYKDNGLKNGVVSVLQGILNSEAIEFDEKIGSRIFKEMIEFLKENKE
jgi:hypothetical protein